MSARTYKQTQGRRGMVPFHLQYQNLKSRKYGPCTIKHLVRAWSRMDGWKNGQVDGRKDSKWESVGWSAFSPTLVPCHALWNKKEDSRRMYVSLVIRVSVPTSWSRNTKEKDLICSLQPASFLPLLEPQLGHHLGLTSQRFRSSKLAHYATGCHIPWTK